MSAPIVSFAGASGTGKTTLATWLSERLGVPRNPVGSRSVALSMGFENPYDTDKADLTAYIGYRDNTGDIQGAAAYALESYNRGDQSCRTLFQDELLRQKVAWELAHKDTGFVTDRTTYDNLVYSILHNVYGVSAEYAKLAKEHSKIYREILFLSVNSFQKLDGDFARVDNKMYHIIYDEVLYGLLGQEVTYVYPARLEARKIFLHEVCKERWSWKEDGAENG
jgi:hypothetical protein